jgi:hypothetical protein
VVALDPLAALGKALELDSTPNQIGHLLYRFRLQ